MTQVRLLLIVLLCAGSTTLWAHWGDQVAKEKTVSKHYTVNATEKLYIGNSYGAVHINTWDKNEITVDVHIKVKAKNEDKAQRLLDDIEIKELRGNNKIEINTEIERRNIMTTGSTEMSIDYTVNMPHNNTMYLTNKFGDVNIEDFDGDLNILVGYGKLKTARLSGSEKNIRVQFGSVDIASIERGKLDISYSNLTIDKAQKIDVKNSFAKTEINSVKQLKISQKYGDLNVGSVDEINGSVEFANLGIDNVLKSAEMILKYCSKANFNSIGAGVDLLKVDASFGNVYCKFENGTNLSAYIGTSFGNFKNHSSLPMNIESIGKAEYSNSESFTGKIGNGAGKMRLNVSYGDVVFK